MDNAGATRSLRAATLGWLELRRTGTVAAGVVGFVLVLGLIDYATGFEISFAVFYVLPVAIAAWLVGERFAVAISVLSAVVWHLANFMAGERLARVWIYYWNAATRLGFFLLASVLVARLRSSLKRERELSRTDSLTGLANGRAFFEVASAELIRSLRYSHFVTVAAVDLDDFKEVNDRLGHAVGDLALRAVSQELTRGLRRTDYAARIGGDEFLILLPETDALVARSVLQRLRASLLASMESNGWAIGFSFGALTLREPRQALDEVLKRADAALYEAKRQGKNRIEHVVPGSETGIGSASPTPD